MAAGSDQLEEDHLGRIGVTRPELDDPRVATRTVGVARRDLREELVYEELVLAEPRERLAPGVKVTALAERDQALQLGLHGLCLRLARLDALVLDDLAAEAAQERLSMRRVAAELVASSLV